MSKYGEWLEGKGFKYPKGTSGIPGKPGLTYINVYGKQTKINTMKPYIFVTYYPQKSEKYFSSLNEAKQAAEETKEKHWQVLNGVTGDIIMEPPSFGGITSYDDSHDHVFIVDKDGKGRTTYDMGHSHTIKDFTTKEVDGHTHDLKL